MTPETGTLPQDGTHPKPPRGVARLHESHQDQERGSREPDHPITVKMARVWSEEYRGNSGTERLRGDAGGH